jgi:hypothetical protein
MDPLEGKPLEVYPAALTPHTGAIEYIDPYEQNECFIANNPAYITPETTHMEVHPSTIMSMMTSLIPFAPHNQSPRNQLSCSQSKQGLSIYATNWRNRFDNTAHVLCYGEMPITRTMYNNYLGEGKMSYGTNCILAIACWSGYNQEDGIVMNYDAIQRGMFRSIAYRSYEAFEEDDEKAKSQVRFGNPAFIANWKDLRPGLDYSKLDGQGIIKEGEYVDETTVIVGAYRSSTIGEQITDASTTPQVWTRGRVEKVVVMVSNTGLRLVKIRVVQDRIPELGDKFCLSADHDVLTDKGWQPIAEITTESVVGQLGTNGIEFVQPSETVVFEHTGSMYLVKTLAGTQYVTGEHRLYVNDFFGNTSLRKAKDIYDTQSVGYSLIDLAMKMHPITSIERTIKNNVEDKVYCLTVPSHIFLVRRKGEETAFWTGNSNRHGQKGTIGALLRGHDMPRTTSGIVPDMIMNPHAIPSRMTIAQNLEQLLGKTAALSGSIGDGTSFMNDGSPQDAIGYILEKMGYEKYGNEVLYNGATGEQINAAIFIGPVYGMRLKHMVEDKWQARGQGRKEMRTHQPTGGRGAQGGLKIGEMDRDAIIAHAGMSFVKESFMERSDGTTIPLCVACGTIPIYNPRLNIAVCSMCDGPVKYVGDTINNMELLPPVGRPKSKIVQVEMPYSTKLLTQEQETYLNLSMRYITTSGITRLTPLQLTGTSNETIKELPRIILPEVSVPAYIEAVPEAMMTVEQLRAMGASVQQLSAEEQKVLDTIVEEPMMEQMPIGQPHMQMGQPQMGGHFGQMGQMPMGQMQMDQMPMDQMPMGQQMQMGQMVQQNEVVYPMQPQPQFQPQLQPQMQGGNIVRGPSTPSSGPVIAVDTDEMAMREDGLGIDFMGGMSRSVRRNPFRMQMGPMRGGQMGQMGQQQMGQMGGQSGAPPGQPITVVKLE